VATALAFACWFGGLRHLDAGTVGLIGLLNPVTGVLLGTLLASETLGARQLAGIALVFAGILSASASPRAFSWSGFRPRRWRRRSASPSPTSSA
jgi:probable blue pigment (indigoidine) exporter